jgi:hypothetical protein
MPSMSMSLCLREVLQPLLRPLSPKPQSLPTGTDATAAAEATIAARRH